MFENITQLNDRTYTFRMNPFHVSYANTLRRVITTGVETVGFRADMTEQGTTTDVVVHKNDTAMTNEMLAHRIGLIPVHVGDPLSWDDEKSRRFKFTLNVSNTGGSLLDVAASDFTVAEERPDSEEPVPVPSETFFRPIRPARDTCLIATLRPKQIGGTAGEQIHLTARATKGTGRENARFIPVSQCSYEYSRDSDPMRIKQFFEAWLQNAKKLDPQAIRQQPDRYAALEREFNTMEVARCFIQDERGEPTSFDFTVESVGVLDVPYIVRRSCEVVQAMCMKYVNIGSGDMPHDVSISPTEKRLVGFDIAFDGHDHTLGNLLQTWLVENHIQGTAEPRITFAGYYIPHTLTDKMVMTIGVADGKEETARAAIAAAARACADLFNTVRENWIAATTGGAQRAQATATPATANQKLRVRRTAAPRA
jgi:DNA-directed RNA polymerase subunit L/DNA-directed RNA polymerase alpha subunit